MADRATGRRQVAETAAATDGALLDRLYAAVGTGEWQPFLDHLAEIYGGGLGAIVLHDLRAGGGFSTAHSETDPALNASYTRHFSRVSPWWRLAAAHAAGRHGGLPTR